MRTAVAGPARGRRLMPPPPPPLCCTLHPGAPSCLLPAGVCQLGLPAQRCPGGALVGLKGGVPTLPPHRAPRRPHTGSNCRSPGVPALQAAGEGWAAAAPALPRHRLLLKLEGQPVLQLPLPCTALCLAPLAGGDGWDGGGSASCGAAGRGGGTRPVRYEPLLLVQAAGSWELPGLAGCTGDRRELQLHLVLVQDGAAPSPPASGGGAPPGGTPAPSRSPAVRGLGSLRLPLPPPAASTSSWCAMGGCPVSGHSPSAHPPQPPVQSEALHCCRLASPATGEEVGSVTLAARLVLTQRAAPLPQPPGPLPPPARQGPAKELDAMLLAQQAGSSKCSPQKQQQRHRKMRSAAVQASPGIAGGAPPCPRQPQPPSQSTAPVLFLPPAACMPGQPVHWPWGVVQSGPVPFLPHQCWPAVGVPAQMQLPPDLLPGGGAAAWGIPLPLHQPCQQQPAAAEPGPPLAQPAPPAPDPLAPRLAAIRTRVQAAQRREQPAGGEPVAAAGAAPLGTLRSPLKAAGRAPPRQHHLREVPSPRRQACTCTWVWGCCLSGWIPAPRHLYPAPKIC